jgi:hypothetical protein
VLENSDGPSCFSSKTSLLASTLFTLLPHWFHPSAHHNSSSYRLIRILTIGSKVEIHHYSSLRCITTMMGIQPGPTSRHPGPQRIMDIQPRPPSHPPGKTLRPARKPDDKPLEGVQIPEFIRDAEVSHHTTYHASTRLTPHIVTPRSSRPEHPGLDECRPNSSRGLHLLGPLRGWNVCCIRSPRRQDLSSCSHMPQIF